MGKSAVESAQLKVYGSVGAGVVGRHVRAVLVLVEDYWLCKLVQECRRVGRTVGAGVGGTVGGGVGGVVGGGVGIAVGTSVGGGVGMSVGFIVGGHSGRIRRRYRRSWC